MKENKRSIITNIKIMILALIVFIPLEFHMYSDDFAVWFYNECPINAIFLKDCFKILSSGVCTGAFVTCLLNRTAYKVAKVSAIEDFCSANYRFTEMLYEDKGVLKIGLPLEDVKQYYIENNTDCLNQHDEKMENAEERLKKYIWDNTDEFTQEKFSDPVDKEKYLDEMLSGNILNYNVQIEHMKELYLKLANELSLQEIDYAFGKIEFIFANKKYRKKLMYEQIYQRQEKIIEELLNFKRLFLNDKHKLPKVVLLEHIFRIQNLLFKEYKISDLMSEDKDCKGDALGVDSGTNLVEYVLVREHEFVIDLSLFFLLKYIYHEEKETERKMPVKSDYGIMYY